jgi:hypothetical protein
VIVFQNLVIAAGGRVREKKCKGQRWRDGMGVGGWGLGNGGGRETCVTELKMQIERVSNSPR